MTCKNCYHHDACNGWINHGETLYSDYTYSTEDCPFYKDKSRIVELPCKVGDSCYPLPRHKTPIVERKVSRITFSQRNIIIGYYENDGQYRPPLRTRILADDVFLTREEAEAALRKE